MSDDWGTGWPVNNPRTPGVVVATVSALVILLGMGTLLGWALNIAALKSLLPGLATMKVNTAAGFVLMGVALLLQSNRHPSPATIAIARMCALLGTAAGLLTLYEYIFRIDLGIDNFMFHPTVPDVGFPSPGRMAPNTALEFTLLGTALLMMDGRSRTLRVTSEILSCIALFLSFVAVLGYFFNARALYDVPGFSSMAIHTAAGFGLLSIGALAARPQRGPVAILIQDNAAGHAARRVLPCTVGLLIAIAWLRLQGQYAGYYGTEFGLALTISTFTAVFTCVVLWNASMQASAEKKMAEVQERMGALVKSAHDAIMTKDLDGVVRSWNLAAERMFGYCAADIVGKSATLLIPNPRLDEEQSILAKITRGEGISNFETVRLRSDGSLMDVELTISPILDGAGALIGASSIMRDIAERKRATEQFRLALEAAPTGMLMMDDQGTIVLVNAQIEMLFGHSRDELLGKTIDMLVPERFRADQPWLRKSFLVDPNTQDTSVRRELYGLRRDGTEVPIEIALNPLRTSEGEFVLSSIADISERKRAAEVYHQMIALRLNEQKLRDAGSVADKANQAKSEFLANMSHEIRTPLNAVIGLGYLLEQTSLSDDQRQFLAKIRFASSGLLNVVNNVLDLTKIEAGEMVLEAEPFDLPELLRDVSLMLTPLAAAKGISLVLQLDSDLPHLVVGDATRLRQVLTNLLANSVKFTEAGQVELKVVCQERDLERIRLRCEVKDTGIGIEPAALAHLFQPFTQADTSTTRQFGGTGLGLSIARRFVELMEGEIGVQSIVAEGSTFWFEVRLQVAHQNVEQRAAIARSLRIFIVDANDDQADGLGGLIRALGWTVTLGTVDQLINVLRNTPPNVLPDVLIFEAHPKETDTPHLIAGLAQQCGDIELPPMIVVADMAQASTANNQAMRATDTLLPRPVSSSVLFNAINTIVWKRDGGQDLLFQSTHIAELHKQWLVGVRTLVVDDSEINVEVAKRILENQGAIVTTCSDGSAAIELVRTQHLELDIVLMDVQMPVIDGNEATRRIRNELGIKTLPIVALTAGALMVERQRSIEAGMNEFVTKPFEPLALIRKVRRLVEHARGAPIPMAMLDTKQRSSATPGSLTSCIDAGIVQRMFGDDLPLFKSLLGRLLRDFADLALPISLHDQASRAPLMARVHKLKGSAGMIGATRVMRLAGAVEEALQQGRRVEIVERLLLQLASALTNLREETAPLLVPELQFTAGASPAPDTVAGPSDTTHLILELCTLLDAQNLAALDRFGALSRSLSERLDHVRFDELRVAVEDLDFPRAARLLRETASPTQAAVA